MSNKPRLFGPKVERRKKASLITSRTPRNQTERIIKKFGGPEELQDALAQVGVVRSVSNIYRWTYPRKRNGTGGLIPNNLVHAIKKAARLEGILLTAEDWKP